MKVERAGLIALALCCGFALAAPVADSADGRWRVQGQGTDVIVLDAGQAVKTMPARSLNGGAPSTVSAVRHLPQRRSFVIAFETLPELWELSVDPDAPPVFDGLVHDYRMGEAIASPGFLGVRRTRLDAPALSIDTEAESFSGVPEQRARRCPIEAQSAAIARAMASICNDERAPSGVMSGHDRKTLSLSDVARGAAYVVVRTADARWLVNLDVRRAIERSEIGASPTQEARGER